MDGEYELLWLAEEGREGGFIPPKFGEIRSQLEELSLKSVVYIDRLDYLISRNGFKETLSFVQYLREAAYLTGNIIILSIDPATLSDKSKLRMLEKRQGKLNLGQWRDFEKICLRF